MNVSETILFKERLYKNCISLLDQRIHTALQMMNDAQTAANEEEKSSAGDKYETARAMRQIDKEMHGRQLVERQHELAALLAINIRARAEVVAVGSLVQSDKEWFFIAAGIGRIIFEEKDIIVLSPKAPLTKIFIGKRVGEAVSFNKNLTTIKAVY